MDDVTTIAAPDARRPRAESPAVAALRSPGVARLLLLSLLARAPVAVLGLLFLLRARDLGGGYAIAGAVSAAAGVGMALGSPLLGRAVDRLGASPVLLAAMAVSGSMLVVGGLLPDSAPAWALLPLALLAGAGQPPVAPCLRTLFGRILPDPRIRHAALAVEASVQEITFMVGPLLFISVLAAHDPSLGMIAGAVALSAATTAFARSPEPRAMPTRTGAAARHDSPLRNASIRTLLAATSGLGIMFGAAEVAITGAAEESGSGAALGLLLTAYCVGSLIAGLLSAHHGPSGSPVRRLIVLLVAATVGHAALAAAPSLWILGLLLVLAGAAIAPLFAVIYGLCGQVAAEGTVTEAYTWLGSGMFAAGAIGSAISGAIVDAASPHVAFLAAASFVGVATVVTALSARSLRRDAAAAA